MKRRVTCLTVFAIFAAVFLCIGFIASTKPKTSTPRPILPPAATMTPAGRIEKIGRDRFGDRLASSGLEQGKATIDYRMTSQWDESSAVISALMDLRDVAPKVFGVTGVERLTVQAFHKFKDNYGNETDDVAFRFVVTRALAGKIKWGSVSLAGLGSVVENEGDGSAVSVHAALRPTWIVYLATK